MATTIAIVERYPLSRSGLAHFLKQHFDGYVVREHESVNELNKIHGQPSPALIILGLNGDWLEKGTVQLASLRSNCPNAKVIVYDDVADSVNAFRYLKGGACGYVSKSEKAASLKDGIDQVLNGKRYITRDILDAIFEEKIFGWKRRASPHLGLTRNESIVARHLIDGLKVSRIAAILHKNMSTVSTFKRRIFEKLGVTNVSELEAKIGVNAGKGGVPS